MMCQITGSIHFAAATPRVNSTFFVQNYWSHTETKVAGMNWALWFECVCEKTRFEQREATAKRDCCLLRNGVVLVFTSESLGKA